MSNNGEKQEQKEFILEATESNFHEIINEHIKKGDNFLVYLYGEHDAQGRSWCPDCEIAQPFVEKIIPKIIEKESDKKVYFINISVGMLKRDIYRNDKILKMKRIPTLIYFSKGREYGRLVEGDMAAQENIEEFIDQIYEDE